MDLRIIALVILAATTCSVAYAAPKKKLLVVTHTAGFRHTEGIEAGDKVLPDMGAISNTFTVEFCRNADDVKRMLTVDYLKAGKFDGVIFNNTTGDLGIPDLKGFLQWIQGGKAFIGMHAATDTYHGNADYLDLIGDEFLTHGAQCKITPIVQDPKHPATAQWEAGTTILEEVYIFKHNDRTKNHVLLYLDTNPPDGRPVAGQPGDCLIAWCRNYGKGRVFYTAFGHRADVWANETVQRHMLGGIRWALGLAKGDAKPGPAKP